MVLSRTAYRAMLVATILASSMAFIDATALNVALPALQADLDLKAHQLIWVVNSYILFLSSLLLFGGSLGDIYGRKKVFALGITIFTVASMLCGFSTDPVVLIVFRALQGSGGALMVPGSLSLISALTSPERKGTAIGTWSMFSSLTTVLGPALGGLLAEAGLWRLIFFINVPLAAICLYALIRYVPESRSGSQKQIDIAGVFLGTLSLGLITYGFTETARVGYNDISIRLAIAAGLVLFVIFFIIEKKSTHPLLPSGIFRNLQFTSGNIITFLTYGALGVLLFFFPLNLIQIQNYSPFLAGMTLLPFGLLIAIFSGISGRLADRIGPRTPLIFGQVLTTFGFFLFSQTGLTNGPVDYWHTYFPPIVLFGVGMGLSVAPLTTLVMNAVPTQLTGIASGVNNTVARSAQVLAIAIIGSFVLITFRQEMISNLAPVLKSVDVLELADEISKFGESQAPDILTDRESELFQSSKNQAFMFVFKEIALISCILTGISTLLTFLTVPRR